jgi:hypothetical protein
MTRVFRYLIAYVLWIVDLGLGIWLLILSRTALLGILGLRYKQGAVSYVHQVDFVDKMFVLLLGLAWLTLMIVLEQSFRKSALTEKLLQRFARVTGILLLALFVVDLILFWVQGVGSGDWRRWLLLAAELGIGIVLILSVKNRLTAKL